MYLRCFAEEVCQGLETYTGINYISAPRHARTRVPNISPLTRGNNYIVDLVGCTQSLSSLFRIVRNWSEWWPLGPFSCAVSHSLDTQKGKGSLPTGSSPPFFSRGIARGKSETSKDAGMPLPCPPRFSSPHLSSRARCSAKKRSGEPVGRLPFLF